MFKEKKFVSDMWHSHGLISTFHSIHDDANLSHMFEYSQKLCRVLGKDKPNLGSIVVNMKTENTGECYAERLEEGVVNRNLEVMLDGDCSRKNDYELVKDLGDCVKFNGVPLDESITFDAGEEVEIELTLTNNYNKPIDELTAKWESRPGRFRKSSSGRTLPA